MFCESFLKKLIITLISCHLFQYLINLNFLGTLHVVKALIPSFKSQREGFIAITASQAALLGIYGYSTYCCTKFALRGLAECLHMEVNIVFKFDKFITLGNKFQLFLIIYFQVCEEVELVSTKLI